LAKTDPLQEHHLEGISCIHQSVTKEQEKPPMLFTHSPTNKFGPSAGSIEEVKSPLGGNRLLLKLYNGEVVIELFRVATQAGMTLAAIVHRVDDYPKLYQTESPETGFKTTDFSAQIDKLLRDMRYAEAADLCVKNTNCHFIINYINKWMFKD
jgi:hypothetical protein